MTGASLSSAVILFFVCGGVGCHFIFSSEEQGIWNKTYTASTSGNGSLSVFRFVVFKNSVVRVMLEYNASDLSTNSFAANPLLAVFREKNIVTSLQVPTIVDNYMYNIVGRTLCPFASEDSEQVLSVELSSHVPVNYSFRAFLLDSFQLHPGTRQNVFASESEPVFFQYDIPEGTDSVSVIVDSNSSSCMTVSVQSIGCPVFDLTNNVIVGGIHQTMTKSASITVERRIFANFYVVFVVRPNDNGCSEMLNIIPSHPTVGVLRSKVFNITIESTSNDQQFVLPIMCLSVFMGLIYLAAICYMVVDHRFDMRNMTGEFTLLEERYLGRNSSDVITDDDSLHSYDILEDTSDKSVVRAKVNLMVSDLSLKTWKQRDQKYGKYAVSLATLALFYALPVVQLVLTWQGTVRLSGDFDLCWYNFRCARPLFGFFAFNNIFSNCGYIFLGLLLIIITKERDMRYRYLITHRPELEDEFGLPQHPGLMYAIGLAVIIEGILSASYHICPSKGNYQFDTSFMYVIGMLGILKIYQLRHPDIIANAHIAFAFVGLFIFIAMIGVYFNSFLFWIFLAFVYTITMLFISVEFYSKGLYRFHLGELRTSVWYNFVSSKCCSCLIPAYKGRFLFLLLGNGINLSFLAYGLIERPIDFPSFLLLPFAGNLFLYMLYYMFMKFIHNEPLGKRVFCFLGFTVIFWCSAMWFFLHSVSDWSITPALSREKNKDCMLLNFFDNHDVWHCLSALAIFSSFTLLDRIDDNLQYIPRNKIPVF